MPDLFPPPESDEFEITVLGRGFGEAIVLHAGDNQWIVIDCFLGENSVPAPLHYLSRMQIGANQVQLLLSTHWHDDHVRGLARLFGDCVNAEIAVPSVFAHDEFQAFLGTHATLDGSPFSSGVNELSGVMDLYSQGRRVFAVDASNILFLRRADETSFKTEVKLVSLSPSPDDTIAFLRNLPNTSSQHGVRLPRPDRNWASVASWFVFGNHSALLGADLTQTSDAKSGWNAVVASTRRPAAQAQLFKIPHHGSSNAHNTAVWSDLLEPNVTSVLAPWSVGRGLPQASDITRIKKTAGVLYTARERAQAKFGGPAQVSRLLVGTNSNVTSLPTRYGFARFRRKLGASTWDVMLDGGARLL